MDLLDLFRLRKISYGITEIDSYALKIDRSEYIYNKIKDMKVVGMAKEKKISEIQSSIGLKK
jgi:hypothetical protein